MDEVKMSSQCCGQTEKSPGLTDQMTNRFDTLCMQSQGFRDLVTKLRDVLGIYNMPAQLSNTCNAATPGEPEPVQPTLTDVARKMKRLIDRNDSIISDFENLLKNL